MKDQIKKLRKEKGLTQEQLSKEMGYNSSALIAMWESGARKPPSDKLPHLAEVLDCTIGDLFGV